MPRWARRRAKSTAAGGARTVSGSGRISNTRKIVATLSNTARRRASRRSPDPRRVRVPRPGSPRSERSRADRPWPAGEQRSATAARRDRRSPRRPNATPRRPPAAARRCAPGTIGRTNSWSRAPWPPPSALLRFSHVLVDRRRNDHECQPRPVHLARSPRDRHRLRGARVARDHGRRVRHLVRRLCAYLGDDRVRLSRSVRGPPDRSPDTSCLHSST